LSVRKAGRYSTLLRRPSRPAPKIVSLSDAINLDIRREGWLPIDVHQRTDNVTGIGLACTSPVGLHEQAR
jgi:hypothetical protein